MANADIRNPIVINATTSALIESGEYLRSVCFVSFGETNLGITEYMDVDRTTFTDFLNGTQSPLAYRLSNFFSYASNKLATILELGEQPRGSLAPSYDAMLQYAKTLPQYSDSSYYQWLLNNKKPTFRTNNATLVAATTNKTFQATMANIKASDIRITNPNNKLTVTIADNGLITYKAQDDTLPAQVEVSLTQISTGRGIGTLTFNKSEQGAVVSQAINFDLETQDKLLSYLATTTYNATSYQNWLTQNKKTDSFANLKEYCNTINVDYPNGYYKYLFTQDNEFITLLQEPTLLEYITTINGSNDAYQTWLQTAGAYSSDYHDKITLLKLFINDSNKRCYIFALPKEMTDYSGTSGLTREFIDTNARLYFALEGSVSTDWSKYEGQKSVLAICNNGADETNNALGAILGKFASSIFDISPSLQASSLNYKFLNGFDFVELGSSTQRELIQNNITYISSKAGNTIIMNGRCMDTRGFDYWYQWDLTAFNIERAIITLLLSGVNNPNYAIRYNQDGIDTINASIVASLNTMISYGCVTEFGASYDSTSNSIKMTGYIMATDFGTYISQAPADYQNEVYQGISFYLRIGKYVRQVVLNVTLN